MHRLELLILEVRFCLLKDSKILKSLKRRELNFFVVRAVERIISALSVGKIIMITVLSFVVGTSKNKNIDMELKKLVLLLYQHKLQMKLTTSLYSVIQQYQVHYIFYVFYMII